LRLVLEQVGDRVSHFVEIVAADGWLHAELQSVEGTSAEPFPPSPPLQSCSVEEFRPGQRAAFLVGMAGKGHWSASMEAIPGKGTLVFDFACRIPSAPAWLGTTYRLEGISPDCIAVDNSGSTALLNLADSTAVLRAEPTSSVSPRIRFSEGLLAVECDIAAPVRGPTTFRWRYCLVLADGQ
jgi:hypothetical protein